MSEDFSGINSKQSGLSLKGPCSPTEDRLKNIWEDVLKRSDIPPDVQFLELGGDSLSAMLCISRMRREFDVDIGLVDFFLEDSTVSEIAKRLDAARSAT